MARETLHAFGMPGCDGGCVKTRGAGEGIEPGVKRSEPQDHQHPNLFESAKRPIAVWRHILFAALSTATRAPNLLRASSWGSASLHPRLYAFTRSAGFTHSLPDQFQ
jgi:hypothetical protein